MFTGRRITTAVVTVMIAFGVGHVMQYGVAGTEKASTPAPRPSTWRPLPTRADAALLLAPESAAPEPTISSNELDFPEPDAAMDPQVLPEASVPPVVVPEDTSMLPPGDDKIGLNGFGLTCEVDFDAVPAPGAVIRLSLSAVCNPKTLVTVEHAGMIFHTRTNSSGQLEIDVPAMTSDAAVSLTVGKSEPLHASIEVPDAVWYDRVALLWSGPAELSIHALEMGAGPGGAGHVSPGRPSSAERADEAKGGFLVRLGDSALPKGAVAEIYSFPSGRYAGDGTVRLSVAAQVTQQNCNRDLAVDALRSQGDGDVLRSTHHVAFPGCEAIGSILVLKNLLQDLKIAQN